MNYFTFFEGLPLVEGTLNVSSGVLIESLSKISFITHLFQAIGGLVLIYVIFSVANFFLNKKKNKEITQIRVLLERIEKQIKRK